MAISLAIASLLMVYLVNIFALIVRRTNLV